MQALTAAAFLAGSLLGLAASAADPAATKPFLPQQPRDLCKPRCFAYSPSTQSWACGGMSSAGGMVNESSRRCGLQVVRGHHVLAEATVLCETEYKDPRPLLTVPLEAALRLVPPDASPTRRLELVPGAEAVIPGGRHRLRLDRPEDPSKTVSDRRGTRRPMQHARLTVLCNRKDALSGGQPGPAEVLVFNSEYDRCGKEDHYWLELGPDPNRVVLMQQRSIGCVDYGFTSHTAFGIDLAAACRDEAR